MYNSMRNKYMKLSDSPANVKRQQFFYFIFFLALSSREYTNKLEMSRRVEQFFFYLVQTRFIG